jgi:uncharacterized protein YerC
LRLFGAMRCVGDRCDAFVTCSDLRKVEEMTTVAQRCRRVKVQHGQRVKADPVEIRAGRTNAIHTA